MTATPLANEQEHRLLQAALDAQRRAYAPYSGYLVGAAVMTVNGEIFMGCNVENASYGLTNCAERSSLFSAVSAGERSFVSLAVVTRDGGAPCGACRQVIRELAPEALILIGDEQGHLVRRYRNVQELLPDAFGPENVQDAN